MENVRTIAAKVLNQCMSAGQYSNLALDTAIKRSALSDSDRGLLTALVYGVIERKLTLDYQIARLSNRPTGEIGSEILMLLRIGLYQLAYMERIPDHAAVNEVVALAPRRAVGFVNAVLRSFIRGGKRIVLPVQEKDEIAYMSVKYSFSPEICALFCQCFGQERTHALLAAFCQQPPLTLRVNPLRTTREALADRLQAAGYAVEPTPQSRVGLRLHHASPTALQGFSEGDFFLQDEASQLCVAALDAQEGMQVLDACACPGSKSFGALMDMNNQGHLIACDLHRSKLSLIESGAKRLHLKIGEVVARDARHFNEAWQGTMDRVLCDVPCSGFGVFAKKPELRYKDPADCEALPGIQSDILRTCARYVRTGGKLVYSTCTLLPRENEEVVSSFLTAHVEFRLLHQRTLYPDIDGTDGFFFAVLEKINENS